MVTSVSAFPDDPNQLGVVTPLILEFSPMRLENLSPQFLGKLVLGRRYGNDIPFLGDGHDPAEGILGPGLQLGVLQGIENFILVGKKIVATQSDDTGRIVIGDVLAGGTDGQRGACL